jgi:hypothetical protein
MSLDNALRDAEAKTVADSLFVDPACSSRDVPGEQIGTTIRYSDCVIVPSMEKR